MHAMMGKSRRSTRDDGRTNLAFELEPNSSSLNSTVIQSSSDLRPQPFHRLFRFASTIDKFMLAIGLTFALLTAACLPIIIIIFGKLINTVIDGGFEPDSNSLLCNATLNVSSPHNSEDTGLIEAVAEYSINTAAITILSSFCYWVYITCFNIAAENQVYRIRGLFFKAALRQDVAWYDVKASNDFNTQIATNLDKIQEGIGEKLGMFISFTSIGVACIITAFVYGWELTLVMMATVPIMTISSAILTRIQAKLSTNEMRIYGQAGGIAEEVLTAIRTVVIFGGQTKEIDRFEQSLVPAKKAGIKRGLISGIGVGIIWLFTYASYAIACWYGIQLVLDSCLSQNGYNASIINVVFFNALYSANKFGQALPFLESFAMAKAAASSIFNIIDRIPPIDSASNEGTQPKSADGRIRFENVHFKYPSRPEVPILRGVSFQVDAGETVALVGSSGCGKSTCVQLIQRFYDPDQGSVKIDDLEVTSLNVKWLRSKISMVGQEPVLFATSIGQNIRYGCEGASQEQVERAARLANAHDFIMRLPDQYDTMVGERGAQLSGGQKQRIAIARALIGNPRILLLDEATSALDTQSEATVQKALDQARQGRTTLIVAHRLTTIRNADRILVFSNGVIEEQGNHSELMSRRGIYFQLVNSQLTEEEPVEKKTSPSSHLAKKGYHEDTIEKNASSENRSIDQRRDERSGTNSEESWRGVSFFRIFKINKPEWPFLALGVLGSLVFGSTNPVYAVAYGELNGLLSLTDAEEIRRGRNSLTLLFSVIAMAAGIGYFLENFMFALAGENFTNRLRMMTFRAMLRQEMGWFDRRQNAVGSLCSRLSDDGSSVQGAVVRMGTVIEVATSLGLSTALALYIDWRLGLVTAVFVPMIILSAVLQTGISSGLNTKQMRALERSSAVATETLSNIRTVASLCGEENFFSLYMESLEEPHRANLKFAPVRGFLFGMTINMVFYASIPCYYYGGYLTETVGLPFKDVLIVGEAMVFGLETVGKTLALTTNFGKARAAVNRIFQLLDREPLMEKSLDVSGQTPPLQVAGKVEFDGVHFRYPNRLDVPILKGSTFEAQPGQTVALVGPSGSGKSTCIQLLQRFYDPTDGEIRLDGHPIAALNLSSLRSHLSIVSQEPMLFNRSISDNIAYGDNSRNDITIEEIIEAAKMANIHAFIQSLPLGYDTNVGLRGAQLSGGQKQRVAIARALIRNPKILILDEATSALDCESERIVQDALDQARQGRTCITIAHRLSTIQNADRIIVMKQGLIEEQGNHKLLMERKGLYHQMWTIQSSAT